MDMTQLLTETASSVAEAASAMAVAETPLAVGPSYNPMPTSFIASTNPPPTTIPTAISVPNDAESSDEEFDEDNPEWAKWNCNQIRTKIRNFLGTKEMTQTAFLKLCDINSNSYYRFMNLKGPYGGNENQTYEGAAIFFYRREKQQKKDKIKLKALKPIERKRKATEENELKAKKAKTGEEELEKIEKIRIPEMDEEGNVPVYDDCDEIRKKINFYLGEKTVTKAAFLRALGNVNSNSLRCFMNLKRGAGSGAANVVYRTAYIFFEKKRILEDGKKTKKRLENETKQGRQGFPLRHDNGMRWVIVPK